MDQCGKLAEKIHNTESDRPYNQSQCEALLRCQSCQNFQYDRLKLLGSCLKMTLKT